MDHKDTFFSIHVYFVLHICALTYLMLGRKVYPNIIVWMYQHYTTIMIVTTLTVVTIVTIVTTVTTVISFSIHVHVYFVLYISALNYLMLTLMYTK